MPGLTWRFPLILSLLIISCSFVSARDFDASAAWKKLISGKYEEVAEEAGAAIQEHERGEDWRLLHGRALLLTGHYPEALTSITNLLRNYSYSIRLRLLARDIFLSNGKTNEASETLDQINELGGGRRWGYRDIEDVIA